MALIICPECGKEISDQAESCPNCGYPLQQEQSAEEFVKSSDDQREKTAVDNVVEFAKNHIKVILAIAIVIIIVIVIFCINNYTNREYFYGIKWGASVEEVEKKFPDMSYLASSDAYFTTLDSIDGYDGFVSVDLRFNANGQFYEAEESLIDEGDIGDTIRYYVEHFNKIYGADYPAEYNKTYTWTGSKTIVTLFGYDTFLQITYTDANPIDSTNEEVITTEKEQTETEENYENAEEISEETIASEDTLDDKIRETETSLEPYINVLGQEFNSDGSLSVTNEFIDNAGNVYLMGYTGTVQHAETEDYINIVSCMEWISNNNITNADFKDLLELLNDYFGTTYQEASYDNISDECYVWIDDDITCLIVAFNSGGKADVRWYWDPDYFDDLSNSTETNITEDVEKEDNGEALLEDQTEGHSHNGGRFRFGTN